MWPLHPHLLGFTGGAQCAACPHVQHLIRAGAPILLVCNFADDQSSPQDLLLSTRADTIIIIITTILVLNVRSYYVQVSTAPAPFDATAPAAYMRETGIAWPNDIDRFSQPDGFVKKSCGGNAACTSCLGAGYTDCGVATDADGKRWAYYYPNDATTQYLHETYPKVVSPLEGVTNEHFMVWMRTAALPTFRKLYGIIDSDIPGGWDVQFDINANFLVANFNGKKSIVLASSVGVGGFNGALGIAYLVIGGVLLLVGLLLLAKVLLKPRPLGFAALHQD
eukprot:TRINITY_DN2106_c0_g1_i3.p1 TRINITY_DN2106_c0_g1~~TRINITY_DN2106_c0_g1_i3.p1  ORF type:complete len:279 (-),score=64.55 TRINITY_DN2106_c0_g1_i3:131-967(-)